MITINSGKLCIPENERFIGAAGDNLHSTKQFMVSNIADENCIYRLYLEFDNGTVNYFVLDSKVENGSTILTWHILQEHIFKSGIVSAQIKSMSESGTTYHTSWDYFIVAPSAEFSGEFTNNENSEFLQYEKQLNELYEKIKNSDLSNFITSNTTIAGLYLNNNIAKEDLYDALEIYPIKTKNGIPTLNEGEKGCFLVDTLHHDLYYCKERNLSGYNWMNLTESTSENVKSITQAEINDNGELVLSFSDETTSNLGVVVGKDGTSVANSIIVYDDDNGNVSITWDNYENGNEVAY